MRLIDADRLKDSIMFTCDLGGWIGEMLLQIKKVAVKYIENAPTIDAVEVVRCEDCKKQAYCHGTVAKTKRHADFVEYWSEPIEWCSKGERKDGEE